MNIKKRGPVGKPSYPVDFYVTREQSDKIIQELGDYFGDLPSITGKHDYAMPRGWQVNIELRNKGGGLIFELVVQSQEGGSFADVKLETVQKKGRVGIKLLPYATGTDPLTFIQAATREYISKNVDRVIANDITPALEIINLSDPKASLLQRKHHDWLKENMNYTNFLGAFQVPFFRSRTDEIEKYLKEHPGVHEVPIIINDDEPDGWLQMSVSGAAEWQDLMFGIDFADSCLSTILDIDFDFNGLAAVSGAAMSILLSLSICSNESIAAYNTRIQYMAGDIDWDGENFEEEEDEEKEEE